MVDASADEFAGEIAAVPGDGVSLAGGAGAQYLLPDQVAAGRENGYAGLDAGCGQVEDQTGLLVQDRLKWVGVTGAQDGGQGRGGVGQIRVVLQFI